MKLSKTTRKEMLQELIDDVDTWDEKTIYGFVKEVRRKEMAGISDAEIVEEYVQCFNCDVCDHCGHIAETGACYYCKMD